MRKLGLICLAVVLAACKTEKFTGIPSLSQFYAIRLNPEAASIGVGETQQLTVTPYDAAACPGGVCNVLTPGNAISVVGTPTFRSTDTTKVKVSTTGLVTGIAVGTANVIATLQDIPGGTGLLSVTKADTTIFTVTAASVTLGGLSLTASRATTGVASPDTLVVTLTDAAGATINTQKAATITGTNVGRPQFYSSRPEIATVSTTGIITGVEPGTATITALITVSGVTKTSTFTVTVTAPVTATFNIQPVTSGVGTIFFPGTLTVSATQAIAEGKAGAVVTFAVVGSPFSATSTPTNTQCFNVTFANPAAALATTPTGLSGNIGTGGVASTNPPLCTGSQARLFTTPGTYTFTNTTNGVSGTLIVL